MTPPPPPPHPLPAPPSPLRPLFCVQPPARRAIEPAPRAEAGGGGGGGSSGEDGPGNGPEMINEEEEEEEEEDSQPPGTPSMDSRDDSAGENSGKVCLKSLFLCFYVIDTGSTGSRGPSLVMYSDTDF